MPLLFLLAPARRRVLDAAWTNLTETATLLIIVLAPEHVHPYTQGKNSRIAIGQYI